MKRQLPYWTALKRPFLTSLLLGLAVFASAKDSLSLEQKRLVVFGGNGLAYSSTMVGLYQLWYKDHDLNSFHFFNDARDWNQMDKAGHAYSCYYEGLVGIRMMKWAGYDHKKASIIGGSYGFLIQTSVEVFDGFSDGWGRFLVRYWSQCFWHCFGHRSKFSLGRTTHYNEIRLCC